MPLGYSPLATAALGASGSTSVLPQVVTSFGVAGVQATAALGTVGVRAGARTNFLSVPNMRLDSNAVAIMGKANVPAIGVQGKGGVGIPDTLFSTTPKLTVFITAGVEAVGRVGDTGVQVRTENVYHNLTGLQASGQVGDVLVVRGENLILQSEAFDNAIWNKRGTVVVTANHTVAPDGTLSADLISNLDDWKVGDLWQTVETTNGMRNEPSFYIKRISTSGWLSVANPHSGTDDGYWLLDMASLPDAWVRITHDTPGMTIINEFRSTTDGSGIHLYRDSGSTQLSFYLWGAQVNYGINANAYVRTEDAPAAETVVSVYPIEVTGVEGQGFVGEVGTAQSVNVPVQLPPMVTAPLPFMAAHASSFGTNLTNVQAVQWNPVKPV